MPLSNETHELAKAAEKRLIEILKEVKLSPDGKLNEETVKKVNVALTDIARESATPPVMLAGVPSEVKREFYKTAADFYTTKIGQSYNAVVSKYRTLYEIAKKNKI